MITRILKQIGYNVSKQNVDYPIHRAIDPVGVEILNNPDFDRSCLEIGKLSLLDTPRLANLWDLSQLSNPEGNIIEIGAYKGGTSIHLSNANPRRKIIICDSFGDSFQDFKPELDSNFTLEQFKDNKNCTFETILKNNGRNYQIIRGFFPGSVTSLSDIQPISFCHLDVDIYSATIDSLSFLEENNCFLKKSLILADDYNRKAIGVNKAITEFTAKYTNWIALPLFPSQCLLIHRSWFD